jgi:hypothetical protein
LRDAGRPAFGEHIDALQELNDKLLAIADELAKENVGLRAAVARLRAAKEPT